MYIVDSGEVRFRVNGYEKNTSSATRGDIFGELALIFNETRSADAIAYTACKLWKIDQTSFKQIMISSSAMNSTDEIMDKQVFDTIMKVPLFKEVECADFCLCLSQAMEPLSYREGKCVVEMGKAVDSFFIIVEGSATIVESKEDISKDNESKSLGPGDFFCEKALIDKDFVSKKTIKMTSNGEVMQISRMVNVNDIKCIFSQISRITLYIQQAQDAVGDVGAYIHLAHERRMLVSL